MKTAGAHASPTCPPKSTAPGFAPSFETRKRRPLDTMHGSLCIPMIVTIGSEQHKMWVPYERRCTHCPRRDHLGHHYGRRSRHPTLPADQRARQTRRPARWQIPPGRHPDLQLHQLRPPTHLRAHTVQLRVAAPAHLAAYQVRPLLGGFVEIFAASTHPPTPPGIREPQTLCGKISLLSRAPVRLLLILSGDQLYRMDFRDVLLQHVDTNADLTVATIPVDRKAATGFRHPAHRRQAQHHPVRRKAKDPNTLDAFAFPPDLLQPWQTAGRRTLSSVHGHLRLQTRRSRRMPRQQPHRFRQAHHPRRHQKHRVLPTSIRDIGKTSAPSARSSRPTST